MTHNEAVKVALIALSARIAEGKHYLKYEHNSKETCDYWQAEIIEAEIAYSVLLNSLVGQNPQREV